MSEFPFDDVIYIDDFSVNLKAMYDGLGDDLELMIRYYALFRNMHQERINELKTTLQNNDLKGLARAAHTLKGTISNLYSDELVERCKSLQKLAESDPNSNFEEMVSELITRIKKMVEKLDEIFDSVND